MRWTLRRVASLHRDLQGFFAFILWSVLFVGGLVALEYHDHDVRHYILAGAIVGVIGVLATLFR